ncbi:MAG: hypothetical protein FWC61_04725 [Proteobacteria bacterium]|nr:hypothetical protein [Pseudomonadota bacterium]
MKFKFGNLVNHAKALGTVFIMTCYVVGIHRLLGTIDTHDVFRGFVFGIPGTMACAEIINKFTKGKLIDQAVKDFDWMFITPFKKTNQSQH